MYFLNWPAFALFIVALTSAKTRHCGLNHAGTLWFSDTAFCWSQDFPQLCFPTSAFDAIWRNCIEKPNTKDDHIKDIDAVDFQTLNSIFRSVYYIHFPSTLYTMYYTDTKMNVINLSLSLARWLSWNGISKAVPRRAGRIYRQIKHGHILKTSVWPVVRYGNV